MTQRRAAVAAVLVAPPVVILVAPTIVLLAANADYFREGYLAGRWLYALALALLGIGAALYALRRYAVTRVGFLAYAMTAPGWILYEIGAQFVGRSLAAPLTAVAVLVAAAVIGLRPVERSLGPLGLVGGVLVVIVGAGSVMSPDRTSEPTARETIDVEIAEVQPIPSIYHLILDEFQTDVFALLLDDERRERLAGFTFFPEASNTWGRTEMSLASTFAPARYAYDEPLPSYIARSFNDPDSGLHLLRDEGYRTEAWLHRHHLFGDFPFDEVIEHDDVVRNGEIPPGNASVAASLWAYAHLPGRLARAVMPEHHYAQLTGDVLLPDDAPAVSLESFRQFLAEEPVRPAEGRYVVIHLIHPHFPYVLDEDCTYREGAFTGAVAQAECAARVVDEFVALLKDLGRFTDSHIVVHSDHGARFEARGDKVISHQSAGVYSDEFVTARARPLLLVKPAGVGDDAGEMLVSDRRAELEDILPTLIPIDRADAVELFADQFPARELRYYHFYDKHPRDIIEGDIHRYTIRNGRARFERTIPVP